MSDLPADSAHGLFLLAEALRGRARGGAPPPRVLDVLLFGRAQARFLLSAAVASEAGADAMPWRELDVAPPGTEPQSTSTGAPGMPGAPRPEHAADAPAPLPGTPEPAAARPEHAVPHAAARTPAAPWAADRAELGSTALPFRQPGIPDEPPPRAPVAATDVGATDAPPSAPAAPADEWAAAPERALPFAERGAAALAFEAEVAAAAGRTGPSRPAAPPPDVKPAAAGAGSAPTPSLGARPFPELPWAAPAVAGRDGEQASTHRAAWPFVPSPARSAAELAERVARTIVRSEPVGEPHTTANGRTAMAPTARGARSVEPPAEARPLTTAGLLREVTRDEVVRALAVRMRALARDDRFRLGELR